jgi:hypothetical protein
MAINASRRLDDAPDDLGPFAIGVRLWSKMIATASPDMRPAIFRNCIAEGASFVRKGAPRGLIVAALTERAERHELLDALGGREAVEKIVAEGLDADARQTANGQDKTGDAPPADDGELLGWDAGDDDQIPPPRGWLLGNSFCRGFASSLLGDGGVGKTALRYAQMLSLATGRSLTGEHVFQRCRVLIVSLEDGRDELRRRLRAARLHHKVELRDIKGWLFMDALGKADGKLMTLDPHGRPVSGALAARLARTIVARKIDIVMLDPFIKSHGVAENDNSGIDEVAQILTDLSIKFDIAVDVPHHMAKGPADPGNANRGRGASSLKDALRLVRTATVMSPEEAKAFGLSEGERRRLVRIDDAKLNIAPMTEAKWFRLVGRHRQRHQTLPER